MATLPPYTFFWRPMGAADDAWTESAAGAIAPGAGAQIEVVSVGPSRARATVADSAPALAAAPAGLALAPGASGAADLSSAFSGTNLRFALSGAPDWAQIDRMTGILSWTVPATGQSGTWSVTASNAGGAPVSAALEATVSGAVPRTAFILIGQSNMVGKADYDGLGLHPAGVQMLGRGGAEDMTLIAPTSPLAHHNPAAGDMGLDIAFAEDWVAANPGRQLILIPGARGASGFDNGWAVGAAYYTDIVTRANAFFAANPDVTLGGILWHQGERAISQAQAPAAYRADLDALIAGLRAEIAVASDATPFVLGQLLAAYAGGSQQGIDIQAVIDDTPNRVVHAAVASSAGLGDLGDGLHFNAASLRTLGARYVAELSAAEAAAPSAPGPVQALAASPVGAQISLSWAAPAATGGQAITSYQVQRRLAGSGSYAIVATTDGATFAHGDATVAAGTAYDYRVRAVNASGVGATGTVVTVTANPAAATAPAQVTGLTATAGDGQVALAWTAPADGGSAITDYVIEVSEAGGAYAVLADGVGTGTSHVHAGLTNGVVHAYRVSAANAEGTGPAGASASATPAAAGPVTEGLWLLGADNPGHADELSGAALVLNDPATPPVAASNHITVSGDAKGLRTGIADAAEITMAMVIRLPDTSGRMVGGVLDLGTDGWGSFIGGGNLRVNSIGGGGISTVANPAPTGQWVYVALSLGASGRVYLAGGHAASFNIVTGGTGRGAVVARDLAIGDVHSGASGWGAAFDCAEVRVFGAALTETQLRAEFDASRTRMAARGIALQASV